MTLYLYKIGTKTPVLTIKKAVSYTAESAVTEEGVIYDCFAADCELSSRPDCSETLRADWRRKNPSHEHRMAAVETMLADVEALIAMLLFGGEAV
ncbi:MAG: hypothetical protein E7443_02815 [Ruminococcaceae bacterium]|nr:hypothetical protein [Oscillospiraceae bacterium]